MDGWLAYALVEENSHKVCAADAPDLVSLLSSKRSRTHTVHKNIHFITEEEGS